METRAPYNCSRCGGPLVGRIEGSCQGPYCERCGEFECVTTYIDPIRDDDTIYQVVSLAGSSIDVDSLRALAHLANVNLMRARRLLQTPGSVLFAGEALAIPEVRMALDAAGVACTVQPAFPWEWPRPGTGPKT